jgi:hypothetical protein
VSAVELEASRTLEASPEGEALCEEWLDSYGAGADNDFAEDIDKG